MMTYLYSPPLQTLMLMEADQRGKSAAVVVMTVGIFQLLQEPTIATLSPIEVSVQRTAIVKELIVHPIC